MIKLLQGDCLELMKDIPNGSVDLVITDIPYGEVNRANHGTTRNLDKSKADIVTFDLKELTETLCDKTKGSIYMFCGMKQVSTIIATMIEKGLSTRLCIWEKTNPSPMNGQVIWLSGIECCVYGKKKNATFNEHCKNTVFRFPTVKGKLHPTQKPIDLMKYLIEVSSNENDIVLDPFMGSGSSGIACKKLNRNFIGIELDKTYFNVAKERIEND